MSIKRFINKTNITLSALILLTGLLAPAAIASADSQTCSPTTQSAPQQICLSQATGLTNGTVVEVSGSGFPSNDNGGGAGAILECNSDTKQPQILVPVANSEVPAGCTWPLANLIQHFSSGSFPNQSFTVKVGVVGPPLASGSGTTTDKEEAAAYPCPPTGPEILIGDVCYIQAGDQNNLTAQVNLSFTYPAFTGPTTLTKSGTISYSKVTLEWKNNATGGVGSDPTSSTSPWIGGVRYYLILVYKGSTLVNTISVPPAKASSTTQTHIVTGLTGMTAYTFKVEAEDYATPGNISTPSNSLTITTPAEYPSVAVSGTITNAATHKALKGVKVVDKVGTKTYTVTTASTGTYKFASKLPAGTNSFTFSLTGYKTTTEKYILGTTSTKVISLSLTAS